jgi:thiol:disulfide interchange protein DsbD
MPCVLPVLTLKITTLVSHAHDRRLIVKTGLSYTFGVLTSFCFLAALAAFAGMGWGSLFQQSGFIIVMTLLLFIFSLSLLGVFTLNLPGFAGRAASTQFGNVAVDSYIKGLMASLLATPCSGPLLGATLAWSLSQPPYIVFTVFTAIGIGMALPYIIISIYPPIVSFIPKPGNWTVIFERVMGFLLLGSVIYFISVLSDDLFIPTLVMLFVSGISIWQYGEWGNLSRSGISQKVSRIVLILLLIAALSIPVYWSNRPSKTVIAQNSYTFSNLQSLARGGQITAVQFTADWCPNCRIVERSVLYTKETEALFKEKNVTLLVADITQSGTEGEKLLHALGSSSIPFLAFFPAGNSFNNPICLRDLYSEKDIVEALRLAGK